MLIVDYRAAVGSKTPVPSLRTTLSPWQPSSGVTMADLRAEAGTTHPVVKAGRLGDHRAHLRRSRSERPTRLRAVHEAARIRKVAATCSFPSPSLDSSSRRTRTDATPGRGLRHHTTGLS